MKVELSTGLITFTHHRKYKNKGKDSGKSKMEKMFSFNTSTLANPFCQKMKTNSLLVCARCYAWTLELFRKKRIHPCYLNNSNQVTRLWKDFEIPQLTYDILRFNAFGELLDKIHYHNLISMVDANPDTMFTLWTKRLDLVNYRTMTHRDNLIYVFSTWRLNRLNPYLPKGYDKAFSVYNKTCIDEAGIEINCSKKCRPCLLCYTKNDIPFINEQVRSA